MTIKQQGGVFGRNPTFNDVEVNTITADGNAFVKALGVNTTSLTSVSGFAFGSFSGSNGGGIVLQQSGTPKASIASFGNDQYIDAVGKTVIRTGATVTGAPVNVMEFQADRNVKMSAGNLIFINGKGIDFSATAGTGTSELFDDYEEGTWTPEITAATVGDLAVTYSVQTGLYTKIGRTVTAYASITTSSFTHSTASGIASVANLPFTVGQKGVGALVFEGITKIGFTSFLSIPNAGTTDAQLYASRSGGTTSTVKITEMLSGGTVFLQFTVTYTV